MLFLMHLQQLGGFVEWKPLGFGTGGLDFTELLEGPLELAGDPMAVHAQGGQSAIVFPKREGHGEGGGRRFRIRQASEDCSRERGCD